MDVIGSYGTLLLLLACAFGLFMAWGIGANDVANAMGTSVGARALTLKQAIVVAAIFEFTGAYLAGGEVTSTIRKGIVDPGLMSDTPELLVYGMLSALLAAGTWLYIASLNGWPVSTTHSIVGAIVGFAAVGISVDAVDWGQVGTIAASWIVSPLLAGGIAFALFISVRSLILDQDDPFVRARRYVPVYMWPHINRHVTTRANKRIVLIENQRSHRNKECESDSARQQRRYDPTRRNGAHLAPVDRVHRDTDRSKSHDCTHNGMCRGDRPSVQTSNIQPRAGSQ